MIKKNSQVFLLVTRSLSKHTIDKYYALKKATVDLGEVVILLHTNKTNVTEKFKDVRIETFSNSILQDLDYVPIKNTLVPGSNHFPVLLFFLKHPQYSYYWSIEDDVAFNGEWKDFFEHTSSLKYDFITSHIRRYCDYPDWFWWDTFKLRDSTVNKNELFNSFNPIYRLSNAALKHIDHCLTNGAIGHHEVLMPSLLLKGGFTIADLGSDENYVTPNLFYCDLSTMRWEPVYFSMGNKKDMLYHPLKSGITFKQVVTFIKRTLENRIEYFT